MKLYRDRILLSFGLASGLISLVVYFLTKAPTLSFWDCGEFIAGAKILGIPHPPGYPLYTLIGRFAILLPLPFTDAVSVNLVSVVSSALTVFVAYWLILRFVVGFEAKLADTWRRLALAVGAFAGSLVMGFSATIWDNAIEAECYGLAMMLTLILAYLLLMWSDRIGRPGAGKIMAATTYFAFLSIGIHLTTFLVIPVFVLYMAAKDPELLRDWRFWLTWIVLTMIVAWLDFFLIGLAALFVISAVLLATSKKKTYMLKWVFALSAAAIVGYSTHLYLPIRAVHKPAINENNPDTWERFNLLLERKQYGQESMITRMLTRRGDWINQFGIHPHMGFFGFFREQYSAPWAAFLFFAVGLWGIYEAIRRNTFNGLWLLALFLVSSVGLIVYLNFSDGTRGIMLEVRNRDYFFTPAFMFFGILIGIGFTGLLSDLAEWAGRRRRRYLLAGALLVTLLFPLHTLRAKYFEHDRSRNYIPWDYAYNILNSVDQDGIVFTNGDNDTFPLWYIQEVEGVRTDIKVVNLSLLNTPWYIHQLKEQMGVPINLTYDQIENLRPVWDPVKERVWKVQDEMIRHIINTNEWRLPVFFAVTVSEGNKLNLNDNMVMQGMAYKVVSDKGANRVDPARMWTAYMESFKYRGLGDPSIYKTENDDRLVANYVSGFLQLADTLRKVSDFDRATEAVQKSIAIFPNEWRHRAYLAGLYAQSGQADKIDEVVRDIPPEEVTKIYVAAAQEAVVGGYPEHAERLLLKALEYQPKSLSAFNNLMMLESRLEKTQAMDSLASSWRAANIDDPKALDQLDKLLHYLDTQKSSDSLPRKNSGQED